MVEHNSHTLSGDFAGYLVDGCVAALLHAGSGAH